MRISLPEPLWMSFYSAGMYRSIAAGWRWRTAAYLGLALALCWTPAWVQMHKAGTSALSQIRARVQTQWPAITIDNGQLSTPEPRRYTVTLHESPDITLVVDATGALTAPQQSPATVVFSRDSLWIQGSGVSSWRSYDLRRFGRQRIDAPRVLQMLSRVERLMVWVLFPLMFVLSFLKRLLMALLTAFLGIWIVRWSSLRVSFPALWALAVVSMTPSLILSTVLQLSGATFIGVSILIGMVAFGYFLFALNAASDRPLDPSESE